VALRCLLTLCLSEPSAVAAAPHHQLRLGGYRRTEQRACQHVAGILDLAVTVEAGFQQMLEMHQVAVVAREPVQQGIWQHEENARHQKHLRAFL